MHCTVHGRPRSIYHRVHLKLLWQAKVSVHAAVPTVTAAAAVLMRVPAVLAGGCQQWERRWRGCRQRRRRRRAKVALIKEGHLRTRCRQGRRDAAVCRLSCSLKRDCIRHVTSTHLCLLLVVVEFFFLHLVFHNSLHKKGLAKNLSTPLLID